MAHLVAAPDKFRGTAGAPAVAAAAAQAAQRAGLTVDEVPLSDGGEGLLDAAGGEERHTTVTGPLGQPVEARWQLVPATSHGHAADTGPTAVIEMAEAAGRALVPHPTRDDPVRATTTGVGELLVAAVEAGASRIIVGCGGSATTDGGLGAVDAVGSAEILRGVEVVVACDVTTAFTDAARVFGPQKGATPEQVQRLTARLTEVAAHYRRRFEVDVDTIEGAGAAGGLAGGLAALGGRLVPGFELVAQLVGLEARLRRADLVVTGEGHLDAPSLEGKVVGGVVHMVQRVAGRVPVLCVVGDADPAVAASLSPSVDVVRLVEVAGEARARRDTLALVEQVVADWLPRAVAGTSGDLAPPAPHAP